MPFSGAFLCFVVKTATGSRLLAINRHLTSSALASLAPKPGGCGRLARLGVAHLIRGLDHLRQLRLAAVRRDALDRWIAPIVRVIRSPDLLQLHYAQVPSFPYLIISASRVASATPFIRAVAIRKRSTGSSWDLPGSEVLFAAAAASSGAK